jgi:hypothetical protein
VASCSFLKPARTDLARCVQRLAASVASWLSPQCPSDSVVNRFPLSFVWNGVKIGANAVVVHSAPDGATMVGIPAKPVEREVKGTSC